MELMPEQLAVLNIFKENDIEEGEYLAVQTENRERQKLPKKVQDNWHEILRTLRNIGYITLDPLGYSLTEKGYHCLHSAEM